MQLGDGASGLTGLALQYTRVLPAEATRFGVVSGPFLGLFLAAHVSARQEPVPSSRAGQLECLEEVLSKS